MDETYQGDRSPFPDDVGLMLARFADQRRIQSALLIAFGLLFPLALVFSGAAVVLTTLRRSLIDGLAVLGGGAALVAVLALLLGAGLAGIPSQLGLLAACLLMARVLARSGSLRTALHFGLGVGLAVLVALLLGLEDHGAWWRDAFADAVDRMIAGGAQIAPEQRARWMETLPFEVMSGMAVGMGLLLCWGALFLGRAWQASLVNPGGFRQEFHQLRLGQGLAIASALLFFIDAFVRQEWLLNIAAVMIHVWIVQGLSLMHWAVAHSGANAVWLWLSYGLFMVFWLTGNPLAVIVPIIGVAGEMIDSRRLLAQILPRKGD